MSLRDELMSITSEEVVPAFGAVLGRAAAGPGMIREIAHTLEKDYGALGRLSVTAEVTATELLGMSDEEAEAAGALAALVILTVKEVAERRELPHTELDPPTSLDS